MAKPAYSSGKKSMVNSVAIMTVKGVSTGISPQQEENNLHGKKKAQLA
jgi:hypothetical protein